MNNHWLESKTEAIRQELKEEYKIKLEEMQNDFEIQLNEAVEEAYQALKEAKATNEKLEVGLYNEFDTKLRQMKDYIVDKVHKYLEKLCDQYGYDIPKLMQENSAQQIVDASVPTHESPERIQLEAKIIRLQYELATMYEQVRNLQAQLPQHNQEAWSLDL